MNYRFTRIWGHASAVVGLGLIAVAFLLASRALFIGPEDTAHFPTAVRATAALLVILVGLILGGTMIVAGQLACGLVDQRDLLERILACPSINRDAAPSSPVSNRHHEGKMAQHTRA